MTSTRIFLLLGLLPLTAAASATSPVDSRIPSTQATISGVYSVTFHANEATPVPAGATLICKARIVPNLSSGENLNAQPAAASAMGRASGPGSTAECSLEVPFSWYAEPAHNAAALSCEVDAISASGATMRVITQQAIAIPYPPQGTTAHVSLTIDF